MLDKLSLKYQADEDLPGASLLMKSSHPVEECSIESSRVLRSNGR